jgi:hypothetical protein
MRFWQDEVGFLALVKVARALDGILAGYSWVFSLSVVDSIFRFLIFRLATTLSGLLPILSVITKMGCWQMSEPGELWYSPFPLPP